MRNFAITLLLASVAMPAVAGVGPAGQDRPRLSRASTDDSSGGGASDRQRPQRTRSSDDDRAVERRGLSANDGQRSRSGRSGVERQRPDWARGRGGMSGASPTKDSGAVEAPAPRAETAGGASTLPQTRESSALERRRELNERRREEAKQRDNRDSRTATSSRDGKKWSTHWRTDRRYDWRHYRDRNRSIYRLGHYYDPYGHNYRRWTIGWSLWPSYYRSSYWLNDPWMYRLPPAYGPYRWVRYWDDALLVDIYSGQVVDVLYNFFW